MKEVNAEQVEQQEEIPMPELVRYQCPNCKKKAVAEKGRMLLCETCVNTFLAKNVGMMEETG